MATTMYLLLGAPDGRHRTVHASKITTIMVLLGNPDGRNRTVHPRWRRINLDDLIGTLDCRH